ncbi:hypothetical protein HK101_011317 [Irineochytrium annulatum]|nr:hypothetical protein HK101_011317 [Irineochytrium annulatum]
MAYLNEDLWRMVLVFTDPITNYACLLTSSSMFNVCAPFLWSEDITLSTSRGLMSAPCGTDGLAALNALMEAAIGTRRPPATLARRTAPWRWKKYLGALRDLIVDPGVPVFTAERMGPWLVMLNCVEIIQSPFAIERHCSGAEPPPPTPPQPPASETSPPHPPATTTKTTSGAPDPEFTAWINYVLDLQVRKLGPRRIELDGAIPVETARKLISCTRVDSVGFMDDVSRSVIEDLKPGGAHECTKPALASYLSANGHTLDHLEIFNWHLKRSDGRDGFLAKARATELKVDVMVGESDLKTFVSEPMLASLRSLNVDFFWDDGVVGPLLEHDMYHIGRLTNLRTLAMGYSVALSIGTSHVFDHLKSLTKLSYLWLEVNGTCDHSHLGDLITALPSLRKLELFFSWPTETPPVIEQRPPLEIALRPLSNIRLGGLVEVVVSDWAEIASEGWPRLEALRLNETALVTPALVDGKRASFMGELDRVLLIPEMTPKLPVVEVNDGDRSVLCWIDGIVGRRMRDKVPKA